MSFVFFLSVDGGLGVRSILPLKVTLSMLYKKEKKKKSGQHAPLLLLISVQ